MLKLLQQRYGNKSFMGESYLYQSLLELRIRPNESAVAYIDRFKTCIEDVQSAGMNIEPKFSVRVFFNSLDARFDTFVNFYSNTFQNGVAIDDGTLQKLFTALIQQEIRNKSTTHDAALNTSRHGPKHNGRPHHKQQQSKPSSVTCSYCNKRNHSEDECRIKAADERRQSESSNSTSRRASFQDTDDNALANTRQNQRSTQRSYGRSSSPVSMMAACHTLLQVHDNLDSSNESILDSGATDHYCKDISWFTTLEPFTGKVRVANGDDMNIEGRGTIELEMNTPSGIVPIRMTDVMYIPSIQFNLFSLSRVIRYGFCTKFSKHGCIITRDNKVYAQTIERANLLFLDIATRVKQSEVLASNAKTTSTSPAFSLLTNTPADLWHARLGHISVKYTEKTKKYTNGIDIEQCKHDFCPSCLAGKQSKLPFPQRSLTVTTTPFELVHSDICGPVLHPALCSQAKYFITFTDDYSRFGFVFLLLHKSDALKFFKKFMTYCTTQFNMQIRCLRSDNGGEYMSTDCTSYLDEHGIRHERTVPHTPQQNGVSERMNRTLVECARSMLHFSNAPLRFWSEAVLHAMYLRNRSYSASTPNGTPYERLYKTRPDLSTLRIFGCEAFTHVEQHDRSKFASKSLRTMYIGHEPDVKGYRLYCANPEKIIINRNVIFNESSCFFIDKPLSNVSELTEDSADATTAPESEDTTPAPQEPESSVPAPSLRRSTRVRRPPTHFGTPVEDTETPRPATTTTSVPETPVIDDPGQLPPLPDSPPPSPSSSTRHDERVPTEDAQDNPPATPTMDTSTTHHHEYIPVYDEPTTSVLPPIDQPQDEPIPNFQFPPVSPRSSDLSRRRHRSIDISDDDDDLHYAKRQRILMSFALSSAGLPTTIRQAYASDERDAWIEATEAEYESLMEHNTWTLCEIPPNRNLSVVDGYSPRNLQLMDHYHATKHDS
ncbi:hypothetical protein Ae201684_012791 [Aphanomyces euteiches]|uniref:Integrase catalytic domain-containing protein n=1 Tax=Aphanomyces euteiches TaxID=100861 RepID=A0A6G0WQ54_9STRA|nr:hypothetical protein Ae201684_012791 [Aphanomyces euteiches]KAH9144228.1 hypothetical protein AeRB84_011824 [Aphanomyces euteiches]